MIWASLVDDPSGNPSLSSKEQEAERDRLFEILKRLVKWENSNDSDVLAEARAEIKRCFPDGPPPILDPFAGGGAIPLEAQRLGLTALAGDLNPVAVLINKAMIEIPPRFAKVPPVHPDIAETLTTWERAQGLAADVEAYGQWMREEAQRRIGHLYPDATGPDGERLTPIAWIWARTVESPDPSWSGQVPLVGSWTLSNKRDKPKVWVEPIIDRSTQTISYEIHTGGEPSRDRTCGGNDGVCVATDAAISLDYIRTEAQAGRMGMQLMAVVAQGERGRTFCSAGHTHRQAAMCDEPEWKPIFSLPPMARSISVQIYGLDEWWKLFTTRQLVALTTFSDLLREVANNVRLDAAAAGMADDQTPLRDGGSGATAYADAVVTYLAFVIDKCANLWSNLVTWMNDRGALREVFSRQGIPMAWDFAEANPFSGQGGGWDLCLSKVHKVVASLPAASGPQAQGGEVLQRDARARVQEYARALLSTDPPYYDNVTYSESSDFFYVWLRNNLSEVWPQECSTLLTPKTQELVANRYLHGSKKAAESHFQSGMAEFMDQVAQHQPADAPATIYYAYKATETKAGEIRSTGWATFLQAVLDAGLQVNATWPMRTESPGRILAKGTNALASSIVLACRPRPATATPATRGEFIMALRQELPESVRLLQSGNIRPVDMAQSAIGPGIKVFSRYERVVEADGSLMPVSAALAIINDVLGEVLDGAEADLDADTRFALTWFAEHGYSSGLSGDADSVARAKNTSLAGIESSGIGEARSGKFRLYERKDLAPDWSPAEDHRPTVWEATQYLSSALSRSESEAAALLHALGSDGDRARQLAYLLYQTANDRGWATEAGTYDGLIAAWPSLRAGAAGVAAAAAAEAADPTTPTLFDRA